MAISEYLPDNYFQRLKQYLSFLNIPWKNILHYIEAFTHGSSYLSQKNQMNYQRLEFLGDAILDCETSIYLFRNFPEFREGELTKLRAKMIQEKTLAKVARTLRIQKYVIVGKNLTNVVINDKILADMVESFVGAIFIDLGNAEVVKFLENNFFNQIEEIVEKIDVHDYKTELQEMLHTKDSGFLKYRISKSVLSAKTNKMKFYVDVYLSKEILGKGIGSTRKEAEQNAAKSALAKRVTIDHKEISEPINEQVMPEELENN